MPELEGLAERLKDLGKDIKVRSYRVPHWFGSGRPKLGVELVETTPELREFLGAGREAGVLIGKVLANTPAERAGVRVGDVIVEADGEHIASAGDLIEHLSDKDGKTVELEIIRDRRPMQISVSIPEEDDDSDEATGPRAADDDAHLREVERALGLARTEIERALESQAAQLSKILPRQVEVQRLVEEELARALASERSRIDERMRLAESEADRARDEARKARERLMRSSRNVI
jgi:membrane-associated protease RseP (regulator of RpoE activity)